MPSRAAICDTPSSSSAKAIISRMSSATWTERTPASGFASATPSRIERQAEQRRGIERDHLADVRGAVAHVEAEPDHGAEAGHWRGIADLAEIGAEDGALDRAR